MYNFTKYVVSNVFIYLKSDREPDRYIRYGNQWIRVFNLTHNTLDTFELFLNDVRDYRYPLYETIALYNGLKLPIKDEILYFGGVDGKWVNIFIVQESILKSMSDNNELMIEQPYYYKENERIDKLYAEGYVYRVQ